MLDMETEGPPPSAAPGLPLALPGPLPAPDRDVLDSARARLAAAGNRPGPRLSRDRRARHLPRPLDDLRAASAVAQQAGSPGLAPAEPLDVGAALVLLSNVRLYLDRLEASLLDLAQQADMSWDLIAAILGIPAAEAMDRLAALHGRPAPRMICPLTGPAGRLSGAASRPGRAGRPFEQARSAADNQAAAGCRSS